MIVAAALAIIAVITAADLAGRRHILPDTALFFTTPREVAAVFRALILFGLSAVPLFMISVISMELGILFRWRTTAFWLAAGIGMLEVIGPFFDLYRWITAFFIGSLVVGIVFLTICQSLQRRDGSIKEWFSQRYRLFVLKMEHAKAERHRDFSPIGSYVLDALLIVFCLSVLAYWGGEAHIMKGLHAWGS